MLGGLPQLPRGRGTGGTAGNNSRRARTRWDPRAIEALKETVADIPKYPRRPETIRVSVFPRGGPCYVDLRVYMRGDPTRRGLVIHRDLLGPVLASLQEAAERLERA